MPTWLAVLVAVSSGVAGGLLSTLVRISDERRREVRLATIDATQDFTALATDLFTKSRDAITQSAETVGEWTPTHSEAEALVREAERRLDRLAVLLGPDHRIVQLGSDVVALTGYALEELPREGLAGLINDLSLTAQEEAELAALSDDEHLSRIDSLTDELLDDMISDAKIMHSLALRSWRAFTEAASLTLGRGLLPRVRPARRVRQLLSSRQLRAETRHLRRRLRAASQGNTGATRRAEPNRDRSPDEELDRL